MHITKTLIVDLANSGVLQTVDAMQNDSKTRIVELVLHENGASWDVPENVSASIAFVKPDGHKGRYDQLPDGTSAVSFNENIITATLAPQVLTFPGCVNVVVILQSTEDEQIATFPFLINVIANPAVDEVVSNDYYTGGLPIITEEDNGKILQVVGGKWDKSDIITKIQQDIEDLKYVPIAITKVDNTVGTVEIGTVVNEITINWTLNKAPAKQTLNGEEVGVSERSKVFTGMSQSENKTFTIAVTDERGATDSETTSITFLNGVYYGVLESGATIDNAAIQAMTKKLQASRGITFTVDAGATQQIIYAIPTRYGTPNFNVGGFDGGFTKATTFNFTNGSGYTESYDVWLSENVGLGSTTVKVS